MLNKRPSILKKSIQSMLLLFCFSVFSFSVPLFSSKAAADTTTLDCLYSKPEIYKMFRFVDSIHHEGLQVTHESGCKLIERGEWDRDTAHEFIYKYIFRFGACRKTNLNPDYEKYLRKEQEMPDSVLLAYRQYCKTTFDPNYDYDYTRLADQLDWLEVEVFCRWTHEIADPSGFWDSLLKPDLPSIKKFEDRTDAICQQLRDDKITRELALYYWQQELLEAQQRLGPETVKEMGKRLKEPLKALINMFKTTMPE